MKNCEIELCFNPVPKRNLDFVWFLLTKPIVLSFNIDNWVPHEY
jgi:hypothetical protein